MTRACAGGPSQGRARIGPLPPCTAARPVESDPGEAGTAAASARTVATVEARHGADAWSGAATAIISTVSGLQIKMFEANTTLLIKIDLVVLGITGVIHIVIICLSRILIKDILNISNRQEAKVLLQDGRHVGPTNWPHLYTVQWTSRDARPDRPHLYTARWTFVLANWTAVLAVAGIGAAVVAVATINSIQQQVDVMHEDFVATNRPWVTVASLNIVNLLLGFPKGSVLMSIRWELINTGRTPAFSVVPNFFGLAEIRGSDLDARKTIREKCEQARVTPFSPFATGVFLTPGKTFKSTENIGIRIPKTIIDKA
jgi:hypothetical protein